MRLINKISEVAGKKRFRPSTLAKEAKISWQTAKRLWNDETKRIEFDTLLQLCRVLECQPGDLLQVDLNNGGSHK